MTPAQLAEKFPEITDRGVSSICLPVSARVPRSQRVQFLIDQPFFHRLRAVRQLGFAHLVYPGATHTRFEHSLGVFARVTQYINALVASERYPAFRQGAGEADVAALLVASLYHDIGHYPFAHAFEETIVRGAPESNFRHDNISQEALMGRWPGLIPPKVYRNFKKTLKELWGIHPTDVVAVLSNRPDLAVSVSKSLVKVLHAVLNGPLDADKLDYLVRDSYHSGNPVGLGIDVDRLVQSLVAVNPNLGLGIREKGLGAAQTLLHARFTMFLTVYWHRVNRAIIRMIAEALHRWRVSDPIAFAEAFNSAVFRTTVRL